jgi:hypothetical protein
MAASVVLARIAVAGASDKRVQKGILAVVVGVIAFIILIIGTFFAIMENGTSNNRSIVTCAFSLQDIPTSIDDETVKNINEIKNSFSKLDSQIEATNSRLSPNVLDKQWVKSVFFSLFFGQPQPDKDFYNRFIECFIITQKVDGVEKEMPLIDSQQVFEIIKEKLTLAVTSENIQMSNAVYNEIKNITGSAVSK